MGPKKKSVGTVDSEWMKHWPKRPWEFWIQVAKVVRARKIRHVDIKKVQEICREVETQSSRRKNHE